jgi:hypothetical protein
MWIITDTLEEQKIKILRVSEKIKVHVLVRKFVIENGIQKLITKLCGYELTICIYLSIYT